MVSTITSNNNNNNNFKTLLYSGKCFGFWDVFLDSGKCYLYSGKCFGFWDVFLDSGKRLSFWEVCSSFLLTVRLSVLCSLGDLPALKTFLSLIASRNNKMSRSEKRKVIKLD